MLSDPSTLLTQLPWANLCVAQLLQPTQPTPPLPPMCSSSTCIFSFLFKCDKCCRRRQITYGKHAQLLLQLLLLQSCKEGMLLGVPFKVSDLNNVFPSMRSFMLNFLIASTSSTPIKQGLPGRVCWCLCVCVQRNKVRLYSGWVHE